MEEPKIKIEIKKGKLMTPPQKDGWYSLEPFKNKRSNPQNAYYWSVIVKHVAEETGYSLEEAHAKLAYKFLLVRDQKTPFVRSTTTLNTAEMEKYNEDCRRWASSFLSLYLPLPGEWE